MKVLLVMPSANDLAKGGYYSGIDYHRMYVPHKALYSQWEDIEFVTTNDLSILTQEDLNEFSIVVCNRSLSKSGTHVKSMEMLNKSNAKLIVDMDDDYILPTWHILYQPYKESGQTKEIIETLKRADHITCTHHRLAEAVREVSNNPITIIPNCILPSEEQFEPTSEIKHNRLVFGWSGSLTHFEDVLELYDSLVPLYRDPDLGKQVKLFYGGYDPNDRISQGIAGVLTGKGIADADQFMHTLPVAANKYANFYNHINVMLIPLRPNRFNSNKSNLKMLEAGFKKRACIVSEVDPYYSVINKSPRNCLTVKNRHDWFREMVKVIKNPNMRFDIAQQLYEDVQPYHANEISKIRYQLYKTI
jgi:hypothetical protein